MARRMFNPESLVWKPLGTLGEFVMLSLLWAVCCIPLVTIGSSTAALYDSAVHVLRRRDDNLFSRFFGTFRRELKSGILSTLFWALIAALACLLYAALRRALPDGEAKTWVLACFFTLVPFLLLCVLSWVFPTLSRFTFDTLPLAATSLRLAFGHILRSAVIVVAAVAGAALCWFFVLPVMLVPGLVALLSTALIEPVFRRYEPEEEEPVGEQEP